MKRLFGSHRQTIVYEKDGKVYLDKECKTPSLSTLEEFNTLSSDIRKNVKIIHLEVDMLKNEKGFTLIELLIVLGIIGVLGMMAYFKYYDQQDQQGFQLERATITIENLQKVVPGKIVGMQKDLRDKSYWIEIMYQGKVIIYSVTPETYYQLHTDMDLPLKK